MFYVSHIGKISQWEKIEVVYSKVVVGKIKETKERREKYNRLYYSNRKRSNNFQHVRFFSAMFCLIGCILSTVFYFIFDFSICLNTYRLFSVFGGNFSVVGMLKSVQLMDLKEYIQYRHQSIHLIFRENKNGNFLNLNISSSHTCRMYMS